MKLRDLVEEKNYVTDKFTSHQYLNTYDALFSPLETSVKNVLEIGIQKGESLLIWKDLFVNANVYGADIDLSPLTIDRNQSRISVAGGNAYDLNFMKTHYSNIKFDILVDDGPHTLESMVFFATHYSSLLAPNGVMVIEDIPILEWTNSIRNALPEHLRSKGQAVDLRHINNRWDDIMFVVKS